MAYEPEPAGHPDAGLTELCARLATRLAADGARHPEAAALALAVRGLRHADGPSFAAEVGVTVGELARIEGGDVAFDDLPPAIVAWAGADPRLDVDRLR